VRREQYRHPPRLVSRGEEPPRSTDRDVRNQKPRPPHRSGGSTKRGEMRGDRSIVRCSGRASDRTGDEPSMAMIRLCVESCNRVAMACLLLQRSASGRAELIPHSVGVQMRARGQERHLAARPPWPRHSSLTPSSSLQRCLPLGFPKVDYLGFQLCRPLDERQELFSPQ
jgi:hypothetical protein